MKMYDYLISDLDLEALRMVKIRLYDDKPISGDEAYALARVVEDVIDGAISEAGDHR